MPNLTLFTVGIIVAGLGLGLIVVPTLTQASVIGVENSLEVSNLRVSGASATTLSMSIKNLKSEPITFFTLVEVSFENIPEDVRSPIKMIQSVIQGSATGEFVYDIKCRIFCNADGSYRPGTYRAYANFWKLAVSQPVICSTDPFSFECSYLQIAPPASIPFTVKDPAVQISFKVQGCYQVAISGGFVLCTDIVPSSEGSITPSGTATAVAGTAITFTATPVEGKSKFTKWIKADGCFSEVCKISDITQSSFESEVQNGQIYTAVFEKIVQIPKPKLDIQITKPESCSSNPSFGVYVKELNEKLTITLTPAQNITSSDGKSTHVSAIIGYTITKANSPIPDTVTFAPDNTFVLGSKTAKTTKEITMDADTTVIISCGASDVLKNPNGDPVKPPPPPGTIPPLGNLSVFGVPLLIGGAALAGVGLFVGGRKEGR